MPLPSDHPEPGRPTAYARAAATVRRVSTALPGRSAERVPGGWLVPAALAGALAAGLLLGPMLVPASADRAGAAAAVQAIGDGAVADPPGRAGAADQRRAERRAEKAHDRRAHRRATRPTVPLTTRFPTVRGLTVDPGEKVTAAIPQTLPLPARSGTGRRIVYAGTAQHLWIVAADGTVVRDYPVTGRVDRPGPGRYRVYSESAASSNPIAQVSFAHMVRFAHGVTGAAIGFHAIPRWTNGRPLQTPDSLGLALGMGGCIRQTDDQARYLYRWAHIGDRVVVLR